MNASPESVTEPLRAESFGATAMERKTTRSYLMEKISKTHGGATVSQGSLFSIFLSLHMLHLKAVLFSAPSHLAASRWRCPHPKQLLFSSGPGCCSCSHGAPGAPCAPAGCAVTDPPSPTAESLPGSRSSPPRTLPAGHGSPVWLLSAAKTGGCSFTAEA